MTTTLLRRLAAATAAALQSEDGRWRLRDADQGDLGLFDLVLSTAPAPQTARLMPTDFAGHSCATALPAKASTAHAAAA